MSKRVSPVSVQEHYEDVLGPHYTWMACGDEYEQRVQQDRDMLLDNGIPEVHEKEHPIAVDLGCGSGFTSLALASLGYKVIAIDTSLLLLHELEGYVMSHNERLQSGEKLDEADGLGQLAAWESRAWEVIVQEGDLLRAEELVPKESTIAVIVCTGDTLTHLKSKREVKTALDMMARMVAPSRGMVLLQFRDLVHAPEKCGLDRYFNLRKTQGRIHNCFLQWESPDSLIVHDLVHIRQDVAASAGIPFQSSERDTRKKGHLQWQHLASSYRKVRIDPALVGQWLDESGLAVEVEVEEGSWMATVVASLEEEEEEVFPLDQSEAWKSAIEEEEEEHGVEEKEKDREWGIESEEEGKNEEEW